MTDLAKIPNFDFSEWSELATNDPEAFEHRRQQAIEQTILTMPYQKQERIRCLQWRIDQERKLAKSPMAACLKISSMMWEHVLGENGLIKTIEKQPADILAMETDNLLMFQPRT